MPARTLWPARQAGGPFARALAQREARPRAVADIAYQNDPVAWMVDVLGISEHTIRWSKNPGYRQHAWDGTQDPLVKIAEGLARGQDVGVESAVGTGKTYFAGGLSLWFVACFEDALVVTTAPKQDQLTAQLWKEIGRHWPRFSARYPWAETVQLRVRMKPGAGAQETWAILGYACGVEAGTESATRAQGFHAEHMLIVTEETPGIDPAVMAALGNTCVGRHNLRLALGNPNHRDDPLHKFSEAPGTVHVRISAFDHPNVVTGQEIVPGATTQKAIDRIADEWGEGTPMYESRVRGISPAEAAEALIKREWCEEAVRRFAAEGLGDAYRHMVNGTRAKGVDVAQSENGDRAAIADWQGAALLEVRAFPCNNATDLGTQVYREMQDDKVEPFYVGVDPIGVGAATANELLRLTGYRVQELNAGSRPIDATQRAPDGSLTDWVPDANRFGNLRSQMWWQFREDLRSGAVAIVDDPQLIRELTTPVSYIRGGKLYVEPKEQIRKRLGGRSPDKADAVVMGNWVRRRWVARPEESTVLESCWSREALDAEYERTHRVGNRQPSRPKPEPGDERPWDPQFGDMY